MYLSVTQIVNGDSLTQRITILEHKLQLLQDKVSLSNDIISQGNDTICNELTAAGVYFTVGSVIIAIVAVVLGIYLTGLAKKVKNIQEAADRKIKEVKDLLDTITAKETKIAEIESNISQMRADVEDLDRNIRHDVRAISDLFRKEDTAALIDRLIEIPEEVINVANMLTSRDLDPALFPKMKEAYINLKSSTEADRCMSAYHLLLFQHFCGRALTDEEISSDLSPSIPIIMENAWAVDMYRSTYDLVRHLTSYSDKEKATTILTDYVRQVESSRHAADKEIYRIITDEGIPDDILKTVWSNLSDTSPTNFGKQLIRHFSPHHDPAFVRTVALSLGLSHEHY